MERLFYIKLIIDRYTENMILGIDEVGRGPWAGPLVVGAVVLGEAKVTGLTDSKKLSAKRREQLDIMIRQQATGWGLGWVHANELDQLGLAESLRVATIRAVEAVKAPYHEIIIDGTINFLKETSKGKYVTTLAKADLLVPSVSAASIIAKVARDAFMAEQAVQYPGYGFEKHVGYGTASHRSALDTLGVTPLHRTSFAPIAKMLNIEIEQPRKTSTGITTKQLGDSGENQACQYLTQHGHKIVERNWKTRWCEIDIISVKEGTYYFVEVKYRKNASAGSGLEAITKTKLRQIGFAAEYYQAKHQSSVAEQKLAVVSITDEKVEYLELE
ncbi:MAG: putative Ribonuclease [Candidatus Saccharibacteria bacterium]|nr:putative Ribonuclease [Candidatus Saccharibacteria bacterium]MDB5181153.1 putative Ribonuclease [Candidatus Saccharibacteria bacterium]